MADSSAPNPSSSIIWLFIFSTIYTVADYSARKKMDKTLGTTKMYFAIYVTNYRRIFC